MADQPAETPTATESAQTLVLRREYPDPIEDVWAAFTDSDRLARWFGCYVGHGRPGGTVELIVTGEVDAGGDIAAPVTVTIHECEPPHRLVVDIPEVDGPPWRVAVDLTPSGSDGQATSVRFEQRITDGIDARDVEAGWNWYLDRLGAALAGSPMPDWDDYATPGAE